MLGVELSRVERAAHDAKALDDWFSHWREEELSRVDRAGLTYLDYTGAALYPESLVRNDALRLTSSVLGNPHSQHTPSRDASRDIEEARQSVLSFLHADPSEYAVIFTANASGACRLVAESFPFSPTCALLLAADNHNSVNGMREYARTRGSAQRLIALDDDLRLTGALEQLNDVPSDGGLLAFPAQSNFSGVRHPLSLVQEARARGWHTFVDAASFLATSDLRLDECSPDFVGLSLYKIAGYPTGVGALVARHDALRSLRRPWFAGGAVDWVSVQNPRHRLLRWPEGFEDGTVSFLALGAVASALEQVQRVGRDRLATHISWLAASLIASLVELRHADGAPVVTIHGPRDVLGRGATVSMTIRRPNGAAIPYWEVEEEARRANVAVRGGCFCNPGCAERALGLSADRMGECFDALGDDFTIPRLAHCLGESGVGAVRMSLGLGSVARDVYRAIEFISRYAQ